MKNLITSSVQVALLFVAFVPCCGGLPTVPGRYPDWCVKIEIGTSVSSGFLLQLTNNDGFLVTARHVFFDTNFNLLARSALLTEIMPKEPTGHQLRQLIVDLQKLLDEKEIRYSTNHDVALIRVFYTDAHSGEMKYHTNATTFTTPDVQFTPISVQNCKRMKDVPVGADTLSAGFSSSASSLHTVLAPDLVDAAMPLLRKGIVAAVHDRQGTFILDARVYGGDSGGPVIAKLEETKYTSWCLIGIQTMVIPGQNKWSKELSNSGYSIIEPMDAILDLLWR